MAALLTPDEELLRRFGLVRAVGGVAYLVAVGVLLAIFDLRAWPLALGVPVLVLATVGYLRRSRVAPRSSVVISLVADALVLGGAVAFVGGSGSGLVLLYSIVIVSAGILLGPIAALCFAVGTGLLALLQLGMEELGVEPALLYNPDLGERLPILLCSLAGLASVGYLTATYASRLHDLIAEAGAEAEVVRSRGQRRRLFVRRASLDVREPLAHLHEASALLDAADGPLSPEERAGLAARLRISVARLEGEVGVLSDVGELDAVTELRPEPVALRKVGEDVVASLGRRLDRHVVDLDVPPVKVVGDRRAARRVLSSLLENVVEHTPEGTRVRVTALETGGQGVLVVTDDGPGVDSGLAPRLFDAPDAGGHKVGLPLVAELCEAMGAQVRYEPAPGGGSRFLVAFRLAPAAAPEPEEVAASET